LARDSQMLTRDWLQACDAYLSVTLAYTRYLLATGRMADPDSAVDVAALEEEHARVRLRLGRLRAELDANPYPNLLLLPQDPGHRLSLAARNELLRYQQAVRADARRLRANSAALVRRSREARRLRNGVDRETAARQLVPAAGDELIRRPPDPGQGSA